MSELGGAGILASVEIPDAGAIGATGADSGAASGAESEVVTTGAEVENASGAEHAAEGEGQGADERKGAIEKGEGVTGGAKEQTPQQVRQILKTLRESGDPASVQAARQLHQSWEREQAFKQLFPGGVKAARETMDYINALGGTEGIANLQDTLANVEAVDAKLYSGDGSVWKDLVEDLKSADKLGALEQLGPAFLDTLSEAHPTAYANAIRGHLVQNLTSVGFVDAVNNIGAALAQGNVAEAQKILKSIGTWFSDQRAKAQAAKVDPLAKEREAIAKEKQAFAESKSNEFKSSVGTEADKSNNQLLGAQLKNFLKMSFFRGFNRENLIPLGNAIKQDLYATLKADQTYQLQMKALWGAKTPDRAKILEYHRTRVESIAPDVVRRTIQRMYPTYAKAGAAAGRVAAAQQKKAAVTAQNGPINWKNATYIATKPSWDSLDMSGKDAQTNFILGRGVMKGTGKAVYWRKPA